MSSGGFGAARGCCMAWEGVGGGGNARLLAGGLLAFTLQWLVLQLLVAAYIGGSCAGLGF